MKKFLMLLVLAALCGGQKIGAQPYHVTGNSTTLFGGKTWGDALVAENAMTEISTGVYAITKDVTVTEDIEFKVVNNYTTWLPENNVKLPLTAGTQVTFIYNSSTGNVLGYTNWTVVGSSDIFGYDWNTSMPENMMTTLDGYTYSLKKENVNLSAATYRFKILANQDSNYGVAYPSSDYELNISNAGLYDVTITFDARTQDVNAKVVYVGDYYVYGGETNSSTNWNVIGKMVKDGYTYKYTFDRQTDSDALTFFVAPGYTVTDNSFDYSWGKLYRPTSAPATISFAIDGGDTQFTGDANKWMISALVNVDFTFNAEDASWSVAPFIEKTIANNDMKLGTFSADGKAAVPAGVTAYIGKLNGDAVTLEEITGAIPANTGILYKGATAGATVKFYATNGDEATVTGNILAATGSAGKTLDEGDYVLATINNGQDLGFYPINTAAEYDAFKAYIPSGSVSAAKLAINFGDETGIANLSHEKTDNVYYDLQGRRVMNPTKGLFIVNGKKVIK